MSMQGFLSEVRVCSHLWRMARYTALLFNYMQWSLVGKVMKTEQVMHVHMKVSVIFYPRCSTEVKKVKAVKSHSPDTQVSQDDYDVVSDSVAGGHL